MLHIYEQTSKPFERNCKMLLTRSYKTISNYGLERSFSEARVLQTHKKTVSLRTSSQQSIPIEQDGLTNEVMSII